MITAKKTLYLIYIHKNIDSHPLPKKERYKKMPILQIPIQMQYLPTIQIIIQIHLNIRMYCEELLTNANVRLILTNQADGCTREISMGLPYFGETREFTLNQVLDDTCRRILPLAGCQIFHVDFANRVNRFLGVYPFSTQIRISSDSIFNGCIQLITKCPQLALPPNQVQRAPQKQKKVKQRTIEQALESVKKWRKLYDTDDGTGKRQYTLDQAARIVGIAKKTLDDYYSLIRTAGGLGFHLEKFRECKIGILRKFVKIGKEEGFQGVLGKMGHCICEDVDKFWGEVNDL